MWDDNDMSLEHVFGWNKLFSESRENDDPGRPLTAKTEGEAMKNNEVRWQG